MEKLDADVVVIGTGPTGGATAWRLASAGVDVLCLDRGDWFDYDGARRFDSDWELRRASRLNSNPNIRHGLFDDPIDDEDSPIKPMIGNNIGGGSIYWSAHVPRFRPEDFRIRALDGIGDDWPIDYPEIDRYYAINEQMLGVAAASGDPSVPPHGEDWLTLPTIGAHGRRMAEIFDRFGWHWWPVDLVVGRDGDQPLNGHCDHIGPCDLGCQSRIRSGADRAYIAEAIKLGARVRPRTKVVELEHGADGAVTAAVCLTDEGRVRITGRKFILCGNGLNTPHLMLLSQSGRFPNGIANGSGLVGRNLMLHPYARVDGLFDEPVGAWVRGEKAGIVSFEFYATRPEHDFKRGLKLQLTGGPGALGTSRGGVLGHRLPWGEGHHGAFERLFDHSCGFTVCAEDLAEPHNRISLSSRLTDSNGMPAAKMTYALSENSRRILDFGMERASEVLTAAGATELASTPLRPEAGFHLMGTVRMGLDPETSVVDPFGRCHEASNLFVSDASVFVTSAAINPTATAQALALRTADHIIETRRH